MVDDWIIRGAALQTRSRQAGGWALKGFDLQRQYAALKVVEMLSCVDGLIAVRYEGAQDIDLKFSDGLQRHVQVKNETSKALNWAALEPVLVGFLKDWMDATPTERQNLRFTLLTTSVPEGTEASKIVRNVSLATLARKVVAAAPALSALHGATLQAETVEVLANTTIVIASAFLDSDLRLIAKGRLTPFFSDPAQTADAQSSILLALKAGEVMTAREALELVRHRPLTDHHPLRPESPFYPVSVGGGSPDDRAIDAFRKGRTVPWEGLDAAIDIQRDAAGPMLSEILAAKRPTFHVLIGPGGAGKTTLARRLAHDLAGTGRYLVFDMGDRDPSPEDWRGLMTFAKGMEQGLVLLLDDPKGRTPALSHLLDTVTEQRLIVLATTRPDVEMRALFATAEITVSETPLDVITDEEVARLSRILGKPAPNGVALERLQASGQIFLLAMVMSEGSVEDFARRLLAPVRTKAPALVEAYLDLCLCARQDQRVPESVLLKLYPEAVGLDRDPHLTGLVTRMGERGDALRAGHALLAEALVSVSGMNPASRALGLLEVVDVSQADERRFALRLVQNVISKDPGPVGAARPLIVSELRRIALAADYADLHRIGLMLTDLGATHDASEIDALLASTPLRTGVDAAIRQAEAERRGDLKGAFPDLLDYFQRSNDLFGRRNFIVRYGEHGEVGQASAMLNASFDWLSRNGYPTIETKAVLDAIKNRPAIDAKRYRSEVAAVLEGAAGDISLLYPAASLIDRRLNDPDMVDRLVAFADRTATAASVAGFHPAATKYGRVLQSHGGVEARRRLTQVLLDGAALAAPDLQIQKNLLMGAVMTAPEKDLAVVRKTALATVRPGKGSAAVRLALGHIRKSGKFKEKASSVATGVQRSRQSTA